MKKKTQSACIFVTLLLASVLPAAAQAGASASVTVPASGRFAKSGSFTGTATVNRVEQRGNDIVAIGVITGTLSREGRVIGTVLAGEVTWRATVGARGVAVAGGRAVESSRPVLRTASARATDARYVLAQESCPVVQIALGAQNIDVLGVQLALDPIALDLSGAAGTPLGDLVCQVSALIGNVSALVGVVNNILALLTGLLGGLTGGIGTLPQ